MIWAWGGLAYTFVAVVQNVLQFSGNMRGAMLISLVGLPIALGLFVCFVLFWVQMYQYGNRLREGEGGYRGCRRGRLRRRVPAAAPRRGRPRPPAAAAGGGRV